MAKKLQNSKLNLVYNPCEREESELESTALVHSISKDKLEDPLAFSL